MSKIFNVSDVLSITTKRLVSRNHIGGVYEILNHMTGENLMTHELPDAMVACKPKLLAAFPELEKVNEPKNLGRLDTLINDAKSGSGTLEEAISMWIYWISKPCECNLKKSYDIPTLREVSP